MKVLLFLISIALILPFCSKKDQVPTLFTNTFSATVNGDAFEPVNIQVLYGGSSIPGAKQVNVYAMKANGHEVVLVMLDYDGTLKTFTNTIGGYRIGPGLYNASYSINGEINISSIDKRTYNYKDGEVVTGTFHFDTDTTIGTYHLTKGKFSVFVDQ